MIAPLDVRNLRISIRTDDGLARVLDDISVTLGRGRVLGVVGESGCGKSTLIRAIMGILPRGATVDAGEIWERRCQGCHGVDGRAHTRTGQRESIDDFTESEWQIANTDDHIRETITEGSKGNAKMKSFKAVLTPGEIEALVLYIRALGVRGPPSE